MANIVELNKDITTPKSVCNKLVIRCDNIKNIITIVEWKDGGVNIMASEMSEADCCKYEKILSLSNAGLFYVEDK